MSDARAPRLLDLLDGFEPADAIETAHVHELARLLATTETPYSR